MRGGPRPLGGGGRSPTAIYLLRKYLLRMPFEHIEVGPSRAPNRGDARRASPRILRARRARILHIRTIFSPAEREKIVLTSK